MAIRILIGLVIRLLGIGLSIVVEAYRNTVVMSKVERAFGRVPHVSGARQQSHDQFTVNQSLKLKLYCHEELNMAFISDFRFQIRVNGWLHLSQFFIHYDDSSVQPLDKEFETSVNNLNPFIGIDTVRYEFKGAQALPEFDTDTDTVQQQSRLLKQID